MRLLRFRNSPKQLFFSPVAILTFAVGFAVVSLSTSDKTITPIKKEISNQIFFVEIPPLIDKNSSNEQIYESAVDYGIELPVLEMQKRKIHLPNICGFLTVSLGNDGKIKLYSEEYGNIENTNILKQKLEYIFWERAENGVFEDNSFKVVKRVIIKAPRSTKYGDVVKVIDAVKQSGADPIILQIDDLPR